MIKRLIVLAGLAIAMSGCVFVQDEGRGGHDGYHGYHGYHGYDHRYWR